MYSYYGDAERTEAIRGSAILRCSRSVGISNAVFASEGSRDEGDKTLSSNIEMIEGRTLLDWVHIVQFVIAEWKGYYAMDAHMWLWW